MKAVIGIGTNVGDRAENIRNAVEALNLLPDVKVLRCASIYETDPWGYTEQQSFYNTVVEVETVKSPEMLLGACLGILSICKSLNLSNSLRTSQNPLALIIKALISLIVA